MRIWMWITLFVIVIVAAAAAFLWRRMTGPMYRPGDARASLQSGESPAPDPASPHLWRVAPDITLYHFEEGRGRPLLIIHGGPGFPPTAPWRAGPLLADRFQLIYYHQRGCGQSTRPIASFTGSNMYQQMQTLHRTLGLPAQIADIERIRRILGRDRLILLGHSFGADMAALYAAEFPERVAALVFVAPASLAVFPAPSPDLFSLVRAKLPAARQPEYDNYLKQYFDFGAAFRRTESESSEFYGKFAQFYGAATSLGGPGVSDASSAGYLPLAVYLGLGKRHDYSAAYRGVQAPVLVIHGGADLQPESNSRAFAAWFPNHRFTRIEGAGHFVFNDQPEQFAQAVGAFLASVAP